MVEQMRCAHRQRYRVVGRKDMLRAAFQMALLFLLVAPAARTAETGYVGPAICTGCHEASAESYATGIHGRKYVPLAPATSRGCESCHGPGAEHVKKGGGKGGIFSFSKDTDAGTRSAKCLTCHQDDRDAAFWDMSPHSSGGLSCNTCHEVHVSAGGLPRSSNHHPAPVRDKELRSPVPGLCFPCHSDVRSQTLRRSRHPIREGRIACTKCHLPHGGPGPKLLKADSANDLCYRCHTEKRGPFVEDHPPVPENCLNCHVPHGSNHYALLVRKTPQLCQSCHDAARHPGTPYTAFETFGGPFPRNRMVARNCVMCHTNIHGSAGSPGSRALHLLR